MARSRLEPLARVVLHTQTDERLVALARRGKDAAFDEIVRRYRPGLVAFAAAYGPPDPEDVVQEGLVRAWDALPDSTGEMHLKAWLYTIVRNRALNARRDARAHDELTDGVDGVRQPAEIVLTNEELDRVVGAVAALPEQQREALVRSALEGHTHEQIARALGSTPGAVRQLIYRARVAVRHGVGFVIPLPLVALLAELSAGGASMAGGAVAGGAAAAGGAGGASLAAKVAAVAAVGAAAVGSGVAIDGSRDGGGNDRVTLSESPTPDTGDSSSSPSPQASGASSSQEPGGGGPSGSPGTDGGRGSDDSGHSGGGDSSGPGGGSDPDDGETEGAATDNSGEGSDDSGHGSGSSGPGSGSDDVDVEDSSGSGSSGSGSGSSGPGGGGSSGPGGGTEDEPEPVELETLDEGNSGPGGGEELEVEIDVDNSGPGGGGSSGSG